MSDEQKKPQLFKREPPTFLRFALGDVVEGVLVSVRGITIQGSEANRYVMEFGEKRFCFNGTTQIDEAIHVPEDLGRYLEIRCTGEDAKAGRSRPMKLFEVFISKDKVRAIAQVSRVNPEITDDDIGF